MIPDVVSTQTWPRHQLPPQLISNSKIQETVQDLKECATNHDKQKMTEIVEDLMSVMRSLDNLNVRSQHNLQRQISYTSMKVPGCTDIPVKTVTTAPDVTSMNGEEEEETKPDQGPWFLRAAPFVSMFATAILFFALTTQIFRWIDEASANRGYHMVMFLTYMTSATVGWGHVPPTSAVGMLFCIVVTTLGVPIMFASFANLGRLFVKNYQMDWIFMTSVVRAPRRGVLEKKRHFPMLGAFKLILLHQFIGVILYNGVVLNYGVVRGMYFNYLAVAMIGFGDIAPETDTILQSTVIVVYNTIGIIILCVLIVSLNYHWQRLFFVVLKGKLSDWYERRCAQQKMGALHANGGVNKL